MEPIKHELGFSGAELGALAGSTFALFYVAASFPLARLADIGIRRNVLAGCLGFWSFMTALCGFAQAGWQLAACRIGVAIGEAGNLPVSMSLVADNCPPEKRARTTSIVLAAQPLGISVALLLGGWFASTIGWWLTFLGLGLPGVLLAFLIIVMVKESAPPKDANIGVQPTIVDALGQFLILPTYWFLATTVLFTSVAGFGLLIWISSFFARVHAMDLSHSGLFLGLGAGTMTTIGSLLSGRLADQPSRRDIRWHSWLVGLATLTAIPVLIMFASVESRWAALGLFCLLQLVGSIVYPPIWAIALTIAGPRNRSIMAASLTAIINGGGLGLGPLVVGFVNDRFSDAYGMDAIRYSAGALAILFAGATLSATAVGLFIRGDIARMARAANS
jgi:predicted MFS family arabinose efflux permease